MKRNNLTVMLVFILLSACGGGGDSGTGDTSVVTTGYFLDSAVEGLNYQAISSGLSGVTDAGGAFHYKTDMAYGNTDPVVFSVGRVELGQVETAMNWQGTYVNASQLLEPSVFMPGDLSSRFGGAGEARSSSYMPINIARFLMMLDEDGDPDNGITISQAVQADAADWPDVNFITANFSSQSALTTIIDSLNTLGTGVQLPAALPDASVASTHLQITFRCVMGGGYSGSWQGDYAVSGHAEGDWYAGIDPVANTMVFRKKSPGILLLRHPYPLVNTTVQYDPNFNWSQIYEVTSSVTRSFSWHGSVALQETLWAEFQDTREIDDTGTGVVLGNKQMVTLSAGTSGAIYHGVLMDISGNDPVVAPYTIAIDGSTVSGDGLNLADSSAFTISGTVSGTSFIATTSAGHTITGQITHNGRTLEATYSVAGMSGSFNACREM